MNKIEVYKYVNNGKSKKSKVLAYYATFCEWGCDYEEFETGAGNYSTAIVKTETGYIKNVPVELVRFIDKED